MTPATVIALQREVAQARAAGDCGIVVDLSAVTLLGARTAALLCGALRRVERTGLRLRIVGGPPHVQRLLQILWLLPERDPSQSDAGEVVVFESAG